MAKLNARITNVNTSSRPIRQMVNNTVSNTNVLQNEKLSQYLDTVDLDVRIRNFSTPRVYKYGNEAFSNFSKSFAKNEPELLFVADYIIDGKNYGVLVVWEKFYDSTHYELFKKNTFKAGSAYERILFLDAASLAEESKHYMSYLRDTVGLDIDVNKTYVILDSVVKEDRIYEYKIKASRVPQNVTEVAYESILESRGLSKNIVINELGSLSVYGFAQATLGSRDFAWTVALMNDQVHLFGRAYIDKAMSTMLLNVDANNAKYVTVATNLNNILNIINDSVSLFGLHNTYRQILNTLGGLSPDFIDSFIEATDESRAMFSYDAFKDSIKTKVPNFTVALQIASTNPLLSVFIAKSAIALPKNTGLETFSSIESITKIFSFVQATYVIALFAQENPDLFEVKPEQSVGDQVADKVEGAIGEDASNAVGSIIDTVINLSKKDQGISKTTDSNKISANGSSAALTPQTTIATTDNSRLGANNRTSTQTTTRELANMPLITRTRTL